METVNIKSSLIKSCGYDTATQTLKIVFIKGETYHYYEVPFSVYNGIFKAKSAGKYFLNNIKNKFKYIKLNEEK